MCPGTGPPSSEIDSNSDAARLVAANAVLDTLARRFVLVLIVVLKCFTKP